MPYLRFAVLVCVATMSGCAAVSVALPYDLDALGGSIVKTICSSSSPSVEYVANRHVDGVLDRIEHRTCVLGSSTMYVSTQASDPTGLAMKLNIHKPGSGLPKFLEIGKPVSIAIRSLGKPTLQNGDRVSYVFGDYGNEVTIQAPGGIIRSVAWAWSID